ncbi:MAG TPA: DUF6680 family protein [Mucilaginibacter sp.]
MEIINVLAILFSPLIAVGVTLWYQKRSEIIRTKKDIFFTIMKNRNSIYVPNDYVQALNSIDFIFNDDEKIKNLWAEYYANLNSKNPDFAARGHLYIDLLSAIASHLGYSNLTQTQIDKYYTPQLHGDEVAMNGEIRAELLRVLKASENYGMPRKDGDDKKTIEISGS